MAPYSHGDIIQLAYADPIVWQCDLFLAITGRYWFSRVSESIYSHWKPKMVHLDLAVERKDFPRVKQSLGPPGRRRFLYIGHNGWSKNVSYLSAIATRMPETSISWMGRGSRIDGLVALGRQDFATDRARALVATHDFMLTVGRSDANPTTVLEAMSWGLVPVCTPQSGYEGEPGVVNIPIDDPDGAVAVLRKLQMAPQEHLMAMQAANDRRLEEHYNWDRFATQVNDAIESDRSPVLAECEAGRRRALASVAMTAPYSPFRPRNAMLLARHIAGRFARKIVTS